MVSVTGLVGCFGSGFSHRLSRMLWEWFQSQANIFYSMQPTATKSNTYPQKVGKCFIWMKNMHSLTYINYHEVSNMVS